jgi:hypothetical protein
LKNILEITLNENDYSAANELLLESLKDIKEKGELKEAINRLATRIRQYDTGIPKSYLL